MNYGNQYNRSPQEPASMLSSPVERDPDGLCNLLSQATDRAAELNERLAKLNQHLSAVLIPEPPEPSQTTNLGGQPTRTTTSHTHDCLYTIMARLEQAINQIGNIADRFRG